MSTATPTYRFTTTLLALFIGLALILTGCGSAAGSEASDAAGNEPAVDDSDDAGGDPDGDDGFGDRAIGPPIEVGDDEVGVEADDVVTEVLDRLDLDLDIDEGEDLRIEIAKAILPAGVDVNDPVALLDALAGRLGPEYADVTDIDVLLDALITELEADGDISSIDDLLTSIAE